MQTHLQGIDDNAQAMWTKLEKLHLDQRPGTRFNAYDDLFSIRKSESESLTAVIARVNNASALVKSLRPAAFTLKELDQELAVMAMIRALDRTEYATLVSNLLFKDKLTPEDVANAFQTEQIERERSGSQSALKASSNPTPNASSSSSSPSTSNCDFCGLKGHLQPVCKRYLEAKAQNEANKVAWRAQKRNNKANTSQQTATVVEVAGNASARTPGSPTSAANNHWNTDTGATSHMTPHRHWFSSYEPCRVPIRLADNSIVYSAGKGTVIFNPVVSGKRVRAVQFSNVLHVPSLQNNLLAVLHLTLHHGFKVVIQNSLMEFWLENELVFTATIQNNTGLVDGSTHITPEAANLTSDILDRQLWHRCLAHISSE